MSVLKLSRDRAQKIGSYASVAVSHDDQIMASRGQHAIEAEHFGVAIRRFAGEHQPRGNFRMLPLQPSHDFRGGITFASNREQDLKRRVVLFKKGPQI
jgi:hypothetical protein